jgi:hypothetical protein
MWTLIIIAVPVTELEPVAPNRGGVSTTTTFLDFPDKQKCDAAANLIAVEAKAPNVGGGGIYRVSPACVQR